MGDPWCLRAGKSQAVAASWLGCSPRASLKASDAILGFMEVAWRMITTGPSQCVGIEPVAGALPRFHGKVLADHLPPLLRPELLPALDTLVQQVRPDGLWLFGSWARGTASRRSDIDLLVMGLGHCRLLDAYDAVLDALQPCTEYILQLSASCDTSSGAISPVLNALTACVNSVDNPAADSLSWIVYPNPGSTARISWLAGTDRPGFRLSFFDVLGRPVSRQYWPPGIADDTFLLPAAAWPPGLYFILIESEKDGLSGRLSWLKQ